ncbi:uncharacterized protein EV420DRAFT_1487227 [Desarmillaria tabescens]|uniref:Uncharacterized protein n=1 Tax=Armillaria tabescens TaxID=1929756 RepID=A0AA39J885_ARMTA|nr:uncharacterized protein EV420DRAFT_1487227 [Desarmillaria tabescens]KAK0437265.1 hypothetical protein EV420DRAFT_1487227 [Desarmillaria tabescens]
MASRLIEQAGGVPKKWPRKVEDRSAYPGSGPFVQPGSELDDLPLPEKCRLDTDSLAILAEGYAEPPWEAVTPPRHPVVIVFLRDRFLGAIVIKTDNGFERSNVVGTGPNFDRTAWSLHAGVLGIFFLCSSFRWSKNGAAMIQKSSLQSFNRSPYQCCRFWKGDVYAKETSGIKIGAIMTARRWRFCQISFSFLLKSTITYLSVATMLWLVELDPTPYGQDATHGEPVETKTTADRARSLGTNNQCPNLLAPPYTAPEEKVDGSSSVTASKPIYTLGQPNVSKIASDEIAYFNDFQFPYWRPWYSLTDGAVFGRAHPKLANHSDCSSLHSQKALVSFSNIENCIVYALAIRVTYKKRESLGLR